MWSWDWFTVYVEGFFADVGELENLVLRSGHGTQNLDGSVMGDHRVRRNHNDCFRMGFDKGQGAGIFR